MQGRFGVAACGLAALEDEVAGGLEGFAAVGGGHVHIEGIAFVLAVHHLGHAFEAGQDLFAVDDAVA